MPSSLGADPDLLIRTGGDLRISNFLIWEIAYTELYFTKTLWPDFGARQLKAALASFQKRQRRFGRTDQAVPESLPPTKRPRRKLK